jgi:hypothetical protein
LLPKAGEGAASAASATSKPSPKAGQAKAAKDGMAGKVGKSGDLLACLRIQLADSGESKHAAALPEKLELDYYYREIDAVFARVFGDYASA